MGSILENNNSFCTAPWLHSYISPQGKRQLCCVANDSFGVNISLSEMWNSKKMKEIRKKMIAGEIIDECVRCYDRSINPYPYKDYWNTQYDYLITNILSNTKKDGSYLNYPISLDYRSNICNFKCKMCTEEFSSQIAGEKIKNNLDLKFDYLDSEEREKSLKLIDKEFSNPSIIENLKEIYWAGGEPMYWKTHWQVLDKLIEKNVAKNVTLRYSTNLSTIEYKAKNITEYFKHFKEIYLYCSLDGTGLIGEYIRTNLNWEKWRENFLKLIKYREEYKNIEIKLAITVTTPTLFDFENLYELCKEFNVIPDFQSCYAENASNLFSLRSFPKNIVEEKVLQIKERIGDDKIGIKFKNYLSFLLKETFFETYETYNQDLVFGFEQIEYLDKNRKHTFIDFVKIISQNQKFRNFYFDKKREVFF